MRTLLMTLMILLLVGCGEAVQDAPKPGDTLTVPTFEWRVRDQTALNAAYLNSDMILRLDEMLDRVFTVDTPGGEVDVPVGLVMLTMKKAFDEFYEEKESPIPEEPPEP